jgi:hypothetical protein
VRLGNSNKMAAIHTSEQFEAYVASRKKSRKVTTVTIHLALGVQNKEDEAISEGMLSSTIMELLF